MSDKNPSISNVAPPAELPSFILQQQIAKPEEPETSKPKFTPAIPPQKQVEDKKETSEKADVVEAKEEDEGELPSMQDIAQAFSPITEGVKNSVLFGWMKSGMKTGVQKAKESIDKVVTTLDPQMAQLICKFIVSK